MAKNELTAKEIIAFLEKKGFQKVTEEDKKTEWYKVAIKKPSRCKSKPPRKTVKA